MPKTSRPEIISERYRKLLFYVAAVLAVIMFSEPIKAFIDKNIVDKKFCYIPTTWYNDLIWFVAIITIGVITHNKMRIGYKSSPSMLFMWLAIAILYSIGRWGAWLFVWKWMPLYFNQGVFYADIVYVFLWSNLAMMTSYYLMDDKAIEIKGLRIPLCTLFLLLDITMMWVIFPSIISVVFTLLHVIILIIIV